MAAAVVVGAVVVGAADEVDEEELDVVDASEVVVDDVVAEPSIPTLVPVASLVDVDDDVDDDVDELMKEDGGLVEDVELEDATTAGAV